MINTTESRILELYMFVMSVRAMQYLVSTMDWHSFVLEDSLRPSAYTCRSLILVMNCIVFIAFVWL